MGANDPMVVGRVFVLVWFGVAAAWVIAILWSFTCPFRESYPDILVVQSSQDRNGDNGAKPVGLDARAHLSVIPSACALDCNAAHKPKEFAAGASR
jgi:hypothetical protein